MEKQNNAVVLFSGGLDSTVLLHEVIETWGKDHVMALNIQYNQKHQKEIEAACEICKDLEIPFIHRDLSQVFLGAQNACSLIGNSELDIPKGPYKDSQVEIPSTYVPFRNGLFLSCAASIALGLGADKIYYAAHSDDAGAAYPDCAPDFAINMSKAILVGTGGQVMMYSPYIYLKKADIVRKGLKYNVPFEKTWSCYEGGDKPCGRCGTCIDRARAFAEVGMPDPALQQ